MTNDYSVIPAHSTERITSKLLDAWLHELIIEVKTLTERVGTLEKSNSTKDETIQKLFIEIQTLKSSQNNNFDENFPNLQQQSATLWANKTAASTKQLCTQIEKENKEKSSKKKNVIIFGLAAKQNVDEDLVEIKKIVNEVDSSINTENIKINRFKSKNNDNSTATSPVQVILNNETDKVKVLKASKKLRENTIYQGIYINPDLTKMEVEATKKLNEDKKKLNENLPNGTSGKKYGMHTFGRDTNESKFFWGIRDFQLVRIKCAA